MFRREFIKLCAVLTLLTKTASSQNDNTLDFGPIRITPQEAQKLPHTQFCGRTIYLKEDRIIWSDISKPFQFPKANWFRFLYKEPVEFDGIERDSLLIKTKIPHRRWRLDNTNDPYLPFGICLV